MKRLMTALLAAVMTVTMAGTALAAEDPAALLERVTQKANELDSMDCDLGVHAVMVMQDPEMDLDLSLNLDMMMNMKMDQIKSGNLRYNSRFGSLSYEEPFRQRRRRKQGFKLCG